MGGGCVIPNFGILQMAASRARSRKKVPQKSRDFWNGGSRIIKDPDEALKVDSLKD